MLARRRFVLGLSALLAPRAFAQAPARIGILAPQALALSVYAPGIVQRLAELGYADRRGALIHYRSSDGIADRYPRLAGELIGLECDLVFAVGSEQPMRALRNARAHMPVVFLAVDYDPLERGLISTLRTPDGNRTGVYVPQNALAAKRFQFMREVVPQGRNFLLFADPFSREQVRAVREASDSAGLRLTVVEFKTRPYDYASAIDAGLKAEAEGLMTLSSPVFLADAAEIVSLLGKHHLPSVGSSSRFVEAGFLLGFGADIARISRRVAELGVKVLKGTRTSDIPVEQADQFELALNAASAKALGVRLPESLLARVTRIVP